MGEKQRLTHGLESNAGSPETFGKGAQRWKEDGNLYGYRRKSRTRMVKRPGWDSPRHCIQRGTVVDFAWIADIRRLVKHNNHKRLPRLNSRRARFHTSHGKAGGGAPDVESQPICDEPQGENPGDIGDERRTPGSIEHPVLHHEATSHPLRVESQRNLLLGIHTEKRQRNTWIS